ncbi:MAG TPA: hypothetical protein VGN07_23775 [Steroidobacteraceae bacterium]|jgi:hypothetical protein
MTSSRHLLELAHDDERVDMEQTGDVANLQTLTGQRLDSPIQLSDPRRAMRVAHRVAMLVWDLHHDNT